MRIAVGGFQHETNTFAGDRATYADFVRPGGWPGLLTGEAIFDGVAGQNLPIAGFIEAAARQRALLVPLLWANAEPSGPVTDDAFERIAGQMIAALAAHDRFDAIYLDLHGAMVTESHEDGEGELLRRLRAVAGPQTLIVASLDLHANVTPAMVEHADLLIAYRTYPHIDMAATGARVADVTLAALAAARPDYPQARARFAGKALRKLPYLIPITAQCTLADPAARIYQALAEIERETGVALSFTPGFPPADIHECGPAVFGFGPDAEAVRLAVERLEAVALTAEKDFAREDILSPPAAIARAREIAGASAAGGDTRPVILADTQDNPGAGGSSDTTGLLRALIDAGVEGATLALFHDPDAARAAHAAGLGAEIEIALGGRGTPDDEPLTTRFQVKALGSGRFDGTGPMFEGSQLDLGPMALLETGGVEVIVGSIRQQPSTQAIFRHLGVEPGARRLLALKSSVHFRADFQPIAAAVLVVAAPGLNAADPASLAYNRLRASVRRRPRTG